MLQTIYQRAKEYFGPRHPYDRPPSRDGCIDVSVYAEPQDEDDEEFLNAVQQLKVIQEQGRTPPMDLLDYFADRFLEREIVQVVGCSFETYLERPLLVEHIRDDIAPNPQSS